MCFPYIMANVDPDKKKGKTKELKIIQNRTSYSNCLR